MPATLIDARQTLRWMLHDSERLTSGVEAFLSAALADVDWELRASAMLGVGLLEAHSLIPEVRQLRWNGDHARILSRWQAAIAAGAPVYRTPPRDHETMLLYALLEPLSQAEPLPHRPGYRFVAGEPHWLGDSRPDMKFPNPIRRTALRPGFWISEARAGNAAASRVMEIAEQQSRRSGLDVRLPTADEWEMAARGTDGRFFPWGNGRQPGAPHLPSPWGLTGLMEGHGEWAWSADGSVLCGSSSKLGLPARVIHPQEGLEAGFRFVVRER